MLPISPPARVEVDSRRRYVWVNDSACDLLGYTREEFLALTIDDVSAPSGAHVPAMFERYVEDGHMSGVFALRRKDGNILTIRFEASVEAGRNVAVWTHYELGADHEAPKPGRSNLHA